MRPCLLPIVLPALALCIGSACGGPIVEWKVADGGNGNFYQQVVTLGVKRDWQTAKLAAESSVFMGVAGHLVTITSPEEQLFVESIYDGNKSWIGLTDDPAFGGMESFFLPNPQVDGWVWVTGEPVSFTNWFTAGEPNNQGGNENFVTMGAGVLPGGWNDESSSPTAGALERYIVEYEVGTTVVPEPASIWNWLVVLAFGAVVVMRNHRAKAAVRSSKT